MNMFLVIENFYNLNFLGSRDQIGSGKALEKDFRIENGKLPEQLKKLSIYVLFHTFFIIGRFILQTNYPSRRTKST